MKLTALALTVLSISIPAAALADPGKGHGKGQHDGRGAMESSEWVPPGLAKKPHGMPPGQAKKMWRQGERLPSMYYTQQRYYVTNPSRYNLSPAPYGYRWIQVGDTYYLAQTETGLISQLIGTLVR